MGNRSRVESSIQEALLDFDYRWHACELLCLCFWGVASWAGMCWQVRANLCRTPFGVRVYQFVCAEIVMFRPRTYTDAVSDLGTVFLKMRITGGTFQARFVPLVSSTTVNICPLCAATV